MLRNLLATTAVAALVASGAYAQTQQPAEDQQQVQQQQDQQQMQAAHEVTVMPGDTVVIEAEREAAEIMLRLHPTTAGAQQQTPDQQAEQTATADPGELQDQQIQAEAVDRSQFDAADLQQLSVDELIGTDVYGAQDQNIGNINDVLMTQEGEVDAVVVDVGGFLGLGAHEVALAMEDIDFMTDAQGNLYAYTPYTQEQLEGAPEYEQATWTEQRDDQRLTGDMAAQIQPQDQQAAQQQDTTVTGETGEHVVADGGTVLVQSDQDNFQLNFQVRQAGHEAAQVQPAEPGVDQETTAAIDRGQMEAVDLQQLRADDLIGSDVYGANEDNIGNVGDILLTEDGSFDAIIVDVGGFLGIGAREVALGLDDVQLMRDEWDGWHVYTPYTQEQLEAAPEYDEATYAEQRDDQRIGVQ